MIKISLDKEKIINTLKELERDYSEGKISKRHYNSQKKELMEELETVEVAERIKRLQGRGAVEKPLEYWVNKENLAKDDEEKEELIEKYVTSTPFKESISRPKSSKTPRTTIFFAVFLAMAFFIGTGFAYFIIQMPSDGSMIPLNANDTAFSDFNNTKNVTRNVTNRTTVETPANTTPAPTPTPTPDQQPVNPPNNNNDTTGP